MRISGLLLAAAVFGTLLTGCNSYGYRGPYRLPDVVNRRSGDYGYRVERDVRDYVSYVDRNVRLSNAQSRRIEDMLIDRTYRVLDRSRSRVDYRVYPFPRRNYRDQSGSVRNWWGSSDAQIERYLTREQRRIYRDMVNYDFRGRDRRYSSRDRVYDRDDRYNDRDYRYFSRGDDDDDDDD